MRLPTRKAELEREAMRQDDHYLTPAKIAQMKRDIEDLVKRQRPEAADEVHRLAQMGDLSENAGYQFAKQHLRRINSRITSIEEKLKHAIPIQAGSTDGKIRIGSTVVVRLNERELHFEVVGSQETNPSRGRISYLSPLGQALMGHRAGEHIEVTTGDRMISYTIINVK